MYRSLVSIAIFGLAALSAAQPMTLTVANGKTMELSTLTIADGRASFTTTDGHAAELPMTLVRSISATAPAPAAQDTPTSVAILHKQLDTAQSRLRLQQIALDRLGTLQAAETSHLVRIRELSRQVVDLQRQLFDASGQIDFWRNNRARSVIEQSQAAQIANLKQSLMAARSPVYISPIAPMAFGEPAITSADAHRAMQRLNNLGLGYSSTAERSADAVARSARAQERMADIAAQNATTDRIRWAQSHSY